MNSSLPSSDFIPPGCEIYAVVGGRLHQPSILTQAFLIVIIVVNTLTFPLTAALNALVMIAVKTKPRLREHKSNICTRLASLDRFRGRGHCTARKRRYDDNSYN